MGFKIPSCVFFPKNKVQVPVFDTSFWNILTLFRNGISNEDRNRNQNEILLEMEIEWNGA